MSTNLFALLQVLQNPGSPAFQHALAEIEKVNPAQLPAEELPAFIAQLETTIANLRVEKQKAEEELHALRNRAQAMRSYQR